MKVTTKGQVTIPGPIRAKYSMTPDSEVDFIEEAGRVYIARKSTGRKERSRFQRLRGSATVKMTTDEILALTRGR